MALTKISGSVIKDSVSLSGNVSVGGTLTYQDVTNVDALGVGTFRSGINVSGGQLDVGSNIKIGSAGIITASNFKTGVTNLHSTGLTLTGGQLDVGSNIKVGTAGVITATSFVGSGANLTGINADLVNDTSPQLGGDLSSNGHHIVITDGEEIRLGDDHDTKIRFNGSKSQIVSSVQFDIDADIVDIHNAAASAMKARFLNNQVELYYANSKKFETTSGGCTITGDLTVTDDITLQDDLYMGDGDQIRMGDGDDFKLYHATNNSYVLADLFYINNLANSENIAKFVNNAGVTLFYNNVNNFETISSGFKSIAADARRCTIGSTNASGAMLVLDGDSDGDGSGNDYAYIHHDTAGRLRIQNYMNQAIRFATNGTLRWDIQSDGHFVPQTNNAFDIGTSSYRVRNIYTNDLNLSNKGSTNSVDNTWGDYTIQEGESDLFLINNRSGKKYKFNLTEVN